MKFSKKFQFLILVICFVSSLTLFINLKYFNPNNYYNFIKFEPPHPEKTAIEQQLSYKSKTNSSVKIYSPGPCLKDNDKYHHIAVSKNPPNFVEINSRRREWQKWLRDDFRKDFKSFDEANTELERNQGFAMKKRGIVIVFGIPGLFKFFERNVKFLRESGCNLPIEVWSFKGELDDETIKKIHKMSTKKAPITTRVSDDPKNFVPMTRGDEKEKGYHIKISALINSKFREVLMLDTDCFVLRNPEYLFDTEEFKISGTIFWPDLWKTSTDSPAWRYFDQTCVDEFEQESGITVVDKKRAWKALGLLWYFNRDDDIRSFLYRFLHGDKDLFRFSWKITETPVHLIQTYLGLGGFMTNSDKNDPNSSLQYCGTSMIQFDTKGKPLFAHVNGFKWLQVQNINETHHGFRYIKMYKPLYISEVDGPIPGTYLSYGGSIGVIPALTFNTAYMCADIFDSNDSNADSMTRDGVVRTTEIMDVRKEFPDFEKKIYKFQAEQKD
ncbi:hypothetical protein HK098_001320 [Nowakowskiella sp. JEL0407]|nr:hypothetical protein HK098_001320 [Nowakowskiella sp. JEL0407]